MNKLKKIFLNIRASIICVCNNVVRFVSELALKKKCFILCNKAL